MTHYALNTASLTHPRNAYCVTFIYWDIEIIIYNYELYAKIIEIIIYKLWRDKYLSRVLIFA